MAPGSVRLPATRTASRGRSAPVDRSASLARPAACPRSRLVRRRRSTARGAAGSPRLLAPCPALAAAAGRPPRPSAAAPPPRRRHPAATPAPPPVYWPLTGIESGPVAPRPALAVKIENSVDARPQTGLHAADMVWEEVVEGGITRFVAVYHSTLPPARSDPLGPAHGPGDRRAAAGSVRLLGRSAPFVDAVAGAGLQVISQDAGYPGFYRLNTRYAPHNVYADPAAFLAQADPGHLAPPGAQFPIATPDQRRPRLRSACRRRGQAEALRPQLPDVDVEPRRGLWFGPRAAPPPSGRRRAAARGQRRRAAGRRRQHAVHRPGRPPVPETAMVGTGEALVATGGRACRHLDQDSPPSPSPSPGRTGGPSCSPGNTWVELVPTGTAPSPSADGPRHPAPTSDAHQPAGRPASWGEPRPRSARRRRAGRR